MNNYNIQRTAIFLAFYTAICLAQIQYLYIQLIKGNINRIIYLALQSIRAFTAINLVLKQQYQNKQAFINTIGKNLVNSEILFQFCFNIPNKNSRPHDVVMYSLMMNLIASFAAEISTSLKQYLFYAIKQTLMVFSLSFQYFHSIKLAVVLAIGSNFSIIQYFQSNSVKSPQHEKQQNTVLKSKVETLFDRHYQQEIGQMNVHAVFTTIIASIRINFNPEIERLVQFTRLMEQLCLEYKVSFVTVSSKTFQFFVSEEVSTIQKKFDQALQLCSGAQVIAKCLDMKVSAGVAFGEIEQVKQIFGNLQYKQYYGDALELADFVSQHSFDEILVDATGLYDDTRKPGADHRYGQHFQEPHFAYKTELRKLDFEGETRLIAVAEPRDTMTKQLSDVLIKSGNINDISLNIVIAPSSEPTTDNIGDSDSISRTVIEKRKARYESSQIQNNCILEIESNSIHKVAENSNVQQYQSQFRDNGFGSFFKFSRRICKLSTKLNLYVKHKKSIHIQSERLSYFLQVIYSIGGLTVFLANNQVDRQTNIASQYGVRVLFGQISLQKWIQIYIQSHSIDIFCKLLCALTVVSLEHFKKLNQVKWQKISHKIDKVLQNIIFISDCQKYIVNTYGVEMMLGITQNYQYVQTIHNQAIVRIYIITTLSVQYLTQALHCQIQNPTAISRNILFFFSFEIVHWFSIFVQHSFLSLAYALLLMSHLPWLLFQFSTSVNNIGKKFQLSQYIKKQASILSRHRMQLQVNSELLLLTKNQPILQQDIVGDLMVKYEKLKTEPVTQSDDETIFMTYLNAKLKHQLAEVPVVHLNNCVLFQLEYGFESVEKTNAVLAEVFQSFGAQHHLLLLRASRKATSWVCYRESGTKADLFPHVQFVLLCLFQLLQKHEHVGVKLAVGDVRGVTLCYEDVHCDVVGEAAAELQDFHSSAGKVKVSKKFWEWYRQHEAGSTGNQAIKFQKRFIDYGVQVEMWK
ncbi:Conserved_hypothetical protein [Hexamita inflata]|uniref:Uncharacterized protein n=1 Tax=Hexamita inflata TaxID=28002 RepID=A0ABP1HJU7_9EUKA